MHTWNIWVMLEGRSVCDEGPEWGISTSCQLFHTRVHSDLTWVKHGCFALSFPYSCCHFPLHYVLFSLLFLFLFFCPTYLLFTVLLAYCLCYAYYPYFKDIKFGIKNHLLLGCLACWTSDSGSPHDLRVMRWRPALGSTLSGKSAGDSLSASPSTSPPHSLSLSNE